MTIYLKIQTMKREKRDLYHEAYDCEWLQNIQSETGPVESDDIVKAEVLIRSLLFFYNK